MNKIRIALAKGRLANKIFDILKKIGIESNYSDDSRKLIFESMDGKYSFFLAKPSDVPTFVVNGAADIGIAGYDTILEMNYDVYQILDLGFGKCSLCVAGFLDKQHLLASNEMLRIATKYPLTAKKYFDQTSRNVFIIKLNGSVELAPLVDLADFIFDIVETGKTLEENNLKVLENAVDCSARVIVNKVAIKTKNEDILELVEKIKESLVND